MVKSQTQILSLNLSLLPYCLRRSRHDRDAIHIGESPGINGKGESRSKLSLALSECKAMITLYKRHCTGYLFAANRIIV